MQAAVLWARSIFYSTLAFLNSCGYTDEDKVRKLWELYERVEKTSCEDICRKFMIVIDRKKFEKSKTIMLTELEVLIKNFERSLKEMRGYA